MQLAPTGIFISPLQAFFNQLMRLAFIGIVGLITACGGGSGGDSPPSPVVTPPSISLQPVDVSVVVGSAASFEVQASGSAPLSYQWLRNGVALDQATEASYHIASTSLGDSGSTWSVKVSNAAGSVTSNSATLIVNEASIAPQISRQPSNVSVRVGKKATFSVEASGTAPLRYQWQRNGVDIANATAASYSLDSVQASDDNSQWRVQVSNPSGSVLSDSASLTVTPPAVAGITVLAGNMRQGDHVDGIGAAARFEYITASVLDSAGNIYVIDNHQLRKISPAGVVTTLKKDRIAYSDKLAVDHMDNLYILTTFYNGERVNQIQRINKDGSETLIFKDDNYHIINFTFDKSGNLYLLYPSNHNDYTKINISVIKIDKNGNKYHTSKVTVNGDYNNGYVFVNDTNEIFISLFAPSIFCTNICQDAGISVFKLMPGYDWIDIFSKEMDSITDVAVDNFGDVFIMNQGNGIEKLGENGELLRIAGKHLSLPGQFIIGDLGYSNTMTMAIGKDGVIYTTAGTAILKVQLPN